MGIESRVAKVGLDAVCALMNAAIVVVLRPTPLTALLLVHVDAIIFVLVVAALAFVVRVRCIGVLWRVRLLLLLISLLLVLNLTNLRVWVVVSVVSVWLAYMRINEGSLNLITLSVGAGARPISTLAALCVIE